LKLWGGNYSGDPDKDFWEFNRSLPFDRRLVDQEIAASRAYVRALRRCQCLSEAEAQSLETALAALASQVSRSPQILESSEEDIHSFVEARLTEALGELAGQAHLGRSRNEQSVTALRLWLLEAIDRLRAALRLVIESLVEIGLREADAVMPGFTHTRPAEPITFGHWAGAQAWGLVRDYERFGEVRRRTSILPLGSGALAGTSLPLDREALARDLGFDRVSENALDAVSDRDFAIDFAFVCAQTQTHLARISEDLMRFSAPENAFLTLPEAFTTGSSLMPQKKNPDALELVRGKAARVASDLTRLLALSKGLPSGYQKDLQEDKEAVFDAAETTGASLGIVAGIVKGLGIDRAAMARAGARPEMMAAGLAVALAREGVPFRSAHTIVGSIVSAAEKEGASIESVAARELAKVAPSLVPRLPGLLAAEESVASKKARGGTAPDAVRESLLAARARTRAPSG
jgi:argininosuccinate lyase